MSGATAPLTIGAPNPKVALINRSSFAQTAWSVPGGGRVNITPEASARTTTCTTTAMARSFNPRLAR